MPPPTAKSGLRRLGTLPQTERSRNALRAGTNSLDTGVNYGGNQLPAPCLWISHHRHQPESLKK